LQHRALGCHTIFTHAVRVELKRRLDITVTQQSVYRLRISLAADQERSQAVTQVAYLVSHLSHFMSLHPGDILARTVHDLYFEPKYEEFRPRTIWSLSNAFTSAFKELDPIPQFKATAKLGEFLEARFSQSF
jgi:hypothetical protein